MVPSGNHLFKGERNLAPIASGAPNPFLEKGEEDVLDEWIDGAAALTEQSGGIDDAMGAVSHFVPTTRSSSTV
jgi:hypothetical protein